MSEDSGRQVLVSAVIVGAAVVLGSVVLALSLDRVTQQLDVTAERLDEIRAEVASARDAVSNLQAAAPAARPREADPDKRQVINVAGAPTIVHATATVTIAEFADFQ